MTMNGKVKRSGASLDFFKRSYMSWSAFMWSIQQKLPHPGKSNIHFLPMINHNPSAIFCVYSTLMHGNERASRAGKTLVITIDQPLYWKAKCMVDAEPATSALRNGSVVLGGYHTRTSFLGAIGFLMADSGFLEILRQVYAPNTVRRMLQGKAVSRAVRGHGLLEVALYANLLSSELDSRAFDGSDMLPEPLEKAKQA